MVCVITKVNNGSKMYVHGGKRLGSAGCIDLTSGNDSFYKDYQNYNDTSPLTVKGWQFNITLSKTFFYTMSFIFTQKNPPDF